MSDNSKGLVYRGPREWQGVTMPRQEDTSGFAQVDLANADFAGRSHSVIAFRAKRLTRRMAQSGVNYHWGGLRWDVRQEGARPQGRDHRPELLRKVASCFANGRTLEDWVTLATARGRKNYEKAYAREALALVVQMFREADLSSRAIQRALGLSASQVTRLSQHEIPNLRRVFAESFTAVTVGSTVHRDGSYERVHIFHHSEKPGADVNEVLERLEAMQADLAEIKRATIATLERVRERLPDDEEVTAAVDAFISDATSTTL